MIYKVERLIRSRYNNVRLYVKICPDLLFQGVGSLLLYYSRKPKVVGSKARLSVWICSIITFHWNKKIQIEVDQKDHVFAKNIQVVNAGGGTCFICKEVLSTNDDAFQIACGREGAIIMLIRLVTANWCLSSQQDGELTFYCIYIWFLVGHTFYCY